METRSITRSLVGAFLTASFLLPTSSNAKTLSVMPLGDSITQGVRGECGYRRALAQALSNNTACAVNFVGSRSGAGDNSNTATTVCDAQNTPHEAIPGRRADQFLNTIDSRITNYQPDVVLLHIGSNDLYQGQDITETVNEVNQLLDRVFTNQPNATVAVANVIPWSEESPDPLFYAPFENPNQDMLADTAQLGAELVSLVNARAAAGDSVELVNVAKDFDNDLMTIDGVHPNPVGETHISNKMLNALYKLGACGGQQPDVQPPITYIGVPAMQDAILPPNVTFSGSVLDEGGSGINRVRIAIQNSAGLWLDHASGTFNTTIDTSIVATMTNTTTNSADWSISANLPEGDYRLYAMAVDNNNNQVEEAAGNGLPGQNEEVWTNRAFEIVNVNISPNPGTTLNAQSEIFSWSEIDPEIVEYRLYAGSTVDGNEYYDSKSLGKTTSVEVTGLPVDGSKVVIRLWYRKADSDWQYVDSAHTAAIAPTPEVDQKKQFETNLTNYLATFQRQFKQIWLKKIGLI